jgi:hypothetical protein
MESEIVFCERCGVSIPEQDVAGRRRDTGGRDLCGSCAVPGPAPGDLQLYFCENCRVSIAVTDVLTSAAKPEGRGYLCSPCSRSTPAERVARRTAVDREMAAAPGAAPPPGGVDPLYFCDSCNSSIPAAAVATGRALVRGGRTWCERCRVRVETERHPGSPSIGFAPVLAGSLLAAALTAGVFVVMERLDRAAGEKVRADEGAQALASLGSQIREARDAAATARELTGRTDTALREMERRVEAARMDAQTARALLDRPGTTGAVAERLARLETRDGEILDALRSLREDMALIAAERREPPVGVPPADSRPDVPPAGVSLDPPGPAPGAPAAPAGPGPEVLRCISLLGDKDIGVRFAAATELGKLGDRSAWKALAGSLRKDEDSYVRRACARSLGNLTAYEAFPDLVETLMDGEEFVAIQSWRVVKEMAGQEFGFKQNQARGERRKVADRAKKWWDENRERLLPAPKAE